MSDRLLALRLFLRVARTASFSKAAREQGLTQPTASRIIATLERELGASLFTRTTRAVTLTEAGSDYMHRVEALLDGLEDADHQLRGSGELRGVLRVGLSSTLAIREIIPRLPRFSLAHPALRIELLVEDRQQDLVTEGVDVALRFGYMIDSSAVARRLGAWPRVIVAAPGYLRDAGTPTSPADLSTHRIITASQGAGPGWSFRQDGREVSIRLESQLVITVTEGAIVAAVNGLGIVSTILPGCRAELADGRLVRLLPDWELGHFELHAVFVGGRSAKPAAKAFADFLKEELSTL